MLPLLHQNPQLLLGSHLLPCSVLLSLILIPTFLLLQRLLALPGLPVVHAFVYGVTLHSKLCANTPLGMYGI